MIVIPITDNEQKASYLAVIIEPDNFERMKKADPITLETTALGFVPPIKYPDNFHLMIAYEEDAGQLYQWAADGKVQEILRHVRRGITFQDIDGKRAQSMFKMPKA